LEDGWREDSTRQEFERKRLALPQEFFLLFFHKEQTPSLPLNKLTSPLCRSAYRPIFGLQD
jgi:hypothetical protein